jgi:hypothetical protein
MVEVVLVLNLELLQMVVLVVVLLNQEELLDLVSIHQHQHLL